MIGIGDYDGKSRNTRQVCTREGQRFYKGIKYGVEKKTGYLVSTSGDRRRLHVVIYEQEVLGGERIPEGCVVHHLDGDKTHNEVSNLACITVAEHEYIHNINDGSRRVFDKFTGKEVIWNGSLNKNINKKTEC